MGPGEPTDRSSTHPSSAPVIAKRSNRPIAPNAQVAPGTRRLDPYKQEVRRRRLKVAVVSGVVVVLLLLLAVWDVRSAAAHYERGRQAFAAQRYSTAIQEFNGARVILFSYRDAETLAAEAAAAIDSGMRREAMRQTRLEALVRDNVQVAYKSLMKGDADAAARALTDARERVPEGELSGDSFTLALVHALARPLSTMCRQALTDGRWGIAGMCAKALLAIDPEDAAALRFTVTARRGADLQERLDGARAAADRGQWRRALRRAAALLDAWPGFPGAASLVERAQRALAPKPKPSPTAAPPATPPAPAPAPAPAPTPPAPPPP